jgi:transcriptional regulator with XRE-family HTH domain
VDTRDIIKYKRLEMGLTMKELADRVGVSEGTVSRWESGNIENMRRDKIALLANVLGTTPAVLMGWSDAERFKQTADEFNRQHPGLPSGIEIELIKAFRKSGDDDKKRLLDLANRFAEVANDVELLKAAHHSSEALGDGDEAIMQSDDEWD